MNIQDPINFIHCKFAFIASNIVYDILSLSAASVHAKQGVCVTVRLVTPTRYEMYTPK